MPVILLSGGIDSATAAALFTMPGGEHVSGMKIHGFTIDYGQNHVVEIEAAKKVAKQIGVDSHIILDISNISALLNSALTKGGSAPIPENRSDAEISNGIPSTYVPCRNIMFLSIAAAYAESVGSNNIVTGFNQIDYSGYPDCRSEFVKSFSDMLDIGTEMGVNSPGPYWNIITPLINMTKAQIIRKGTELGVDYSNTVSCYQAKVNEEGKIVACGKCDSCIIRRKGFEEANVKDPTIYE